MALDLGRTDRSAVIGYYLTASWRLTRKPTQRKGRLRDRKLPSPVDSHEPPHLALLQTGWLKTTELYSLVVLEAVKSNIKVLAGSHAL